MSYYDNGPWSPAGARQGAWEPQHPLSRSGTITTAPEEPDAFYYQMANIDRAIENWRKSGKLPMNMYGARRESMPMMAGRQFPEFDPRMGGPQRHSVAEFEAMRSHAGSGLQNFYATQRFSGRPAETDQGLQAKRRMAAQRERELRNYHQEQQYQKHLSGAKSDRSMSPNTGVSEEERRELIARQHRALYGADSNLYGNDAAASRPLSQDARVATANMSSVLRGNSPLAYDPFGMQQSNPGNVSDPAVTMPSRDAKDSAAGTQRSRANSTSSPSSNPNNSSSFSIFENNNAQQSSRTSTSSPGGSPPRNSKPSATSGGSVAPIGTRPAASQTSGAPQPGGLQKRSTTPLPSPLSYGFSASEQTQPEKASTATEDKFGSIRSGWGNSGVWGSKGPLGVQTNVAWG